ncbi:MAG TPA: aldo/keto reductase [Candidatus Acidoferrales bacterium]|nr:aldo/keto reductase [Candidatus Acidoferrales bacterium]
MKRRDFIRYTALSAGAVTFSPYTKLFPPDDKKKYASDVVTLGKTGIKASRLAMGTGTHGYNHQSDQSRSDLPGLLRAAFDHGINFWDSADQYGTHPDLKEALKSVPREKVVILTKTEATTADEMKSDLDRFREEIGTDYIDVVLLHMMTSADWPTEKQGTMEVLERARQEGTIRAHGVSCHTFEALEAASNSDWVQVDFARINPAGIIMDAEVNAVVKVLKKMHDDGKGVVGMKIFGAGRLVDRRDECLRYVLSLDFVDAFTIGQRSQDEMLDLVKRIPAVSTSD